MKEYIFIRHDFVNSLIACLRKQGGGVRGSKNMLDFYKDLMEQNEMQKNASKILFLAKVMNFLKFGLQLNYYTHANFKRYY